MKALLTTLLSLIIKEITAAIISAVTESISKKDTSLKVEDQLDGYTQSKATTVDKLISKYSRVRD